MIPLGYYIVRRSGEKPRPSWTAPDYLTVAGCLCEGVLPEFEAGGGNAPAPRDAFAFVSREQFPSSQTWPD